MLDNQSSDGTRETLADEGLLEQVDYVRSEENTGGAGGYRRGVELALETGSDWIWLMDDDAEPRPDALATLLASAEAQDPATVAVCTSVVHPDGTVDVLHRCHHGRLITPLADAVRGPPRGRLRVVRRAARARRRRARGRPAARPSSSSATTTPSGRCGCARAAARSA